MSHPSLLDHPYLLTAWLAIIALKVALGCFPLPVPLVLWLWVSVLRSLVMLAATALWWLPVWNFARYQGEFIESGMALLCAVWAAYILFTDRPPDMQHVWVKQWVMFISAGLIAIIVSYRYDVKDLQPIEVWTWGYVFFTAGVFWIIAVFADWANGHDRPAINDARIVVLGFMVAYTIDAAADGIATWSARTMHARLPAWCLSMGSAAAVYAWWIWKFRAVKSNNERRKPIGSS